MPEEAQDERAHKPGIDYVVEIDALRALHLNVKLAEIVSVDCHEVNLRVSELIKLCEGEDISALKLLAGIASFHFVPDHVTQPFAPMMIFDGKRSLVPTDLLAEQIDVLADFAPSVEHHGLRARLSDVVWFMQRRRLDMAEAAIGAYCDSVDAVRAGRAEFAFGSKSAWCVGSANALTRAARISRLTRWELPASARVSTLLNDLVTAAYDDGREDDFGRIADVDLGHRITPPAEIGKMAEELAVGERLSANPEARLRLFELAVRAQRMAGDEQGAQRCMLAIAECHVQKAELARSPMLEAMFLNDAIQVLRNLPGTREKREQLTAKLREAQVGIGEEMSEFSTEIDLSEIVERAVGSVRGHSWPSAFLSLVLCDLPPTPEQIREAALEHARQHPLQALMPMQVHDFQGRVVFRSPGMADEGEAGGEHLRYLMAIHRSIGRKVVVEGIINPIRRTIASEHLISADVLVHMLRDSPFMPSDHAFAYARAICHFLAGDDIEAISILVPQLENSLRHILSLKGFDTTVPNPDGTQTEASLSILLKPDRPWRALLEATIPPKYIQEIDLLFDFPGGPSVRNQVAHGKVPSNGFWEVDFTYAAWLIIHLAALPLAHHWGDVEEIFVRVTGLRRPEPEENVE